MATAKAGQSKGGAIAEGEFLLTEADFGTIAKILYEDSGITLPPSKSALVYSRLAKRLRGLGLESFRDYCAFIADSSNTTERMAMLAALTTNVTHFFREQHHFDHLRTQLLPGLLAKAKQGGKLRIWSAGCSNGHEPYSIAMTILSLMPDAAEYDVRVLASDIDPNVVAFGRAGLYDAETLEPVPREMRRRWFRPARQADAAGRMLFEVADEMRELVAFRELNLNGDWPMRGKFDAIFCRNVTIYFDMPTRERVWRRFCDFLEPGSWFYMGHSERLTGPAAAHLTFSGTTAYRFTGGTTR